ncbi:MAG TPA: efflux RND transporter periplasmic adaptor subunit [Acidocella sp.]|uniref:efflux RND transporter periplasmic adaptor subunit n=1 Tax=Acidocella sp. TaxID=50710 RepID=UPI002D0185A3|nr:efflux RND transporter periplasmic adaptor subunit [Acidocella sp.]HVE21373.1 efflux RND transporter periplasmic adaptor subunit [Acidocella sp.]
MSTPAAPSGGPIVSVFHPADKKTHWIHPWSGRNGAIAAASLAALVLVSGCSKKQTPPATALPQVGVITVHTQPVARITDLPGRTSAVLTSEIRPQVSGVILKRLFAEGSDVKAGQPLYQIDPATYQASYDSAEATLKHAQAALATDRAKAARYKPLAAAQAVSEQDYDDAVAATLEDEADIASAKAALDQAQINLQYTRMYAPISGTIGASSVTPGALVTADQATALATVTQLDPIYVDVNESSATWLRLKQEQDSGQFERQGAGAAKVSLMLEDGSTYPLTGKLQFSQVNVDEMTGTVLVRAIFSNPNHLLLPGMYVHAKLEEGVNKNGILIPQQAVSHDTRGDATVLLVGAKNMVSQRVIQIGGNVGSDWIITGGLQPGDKVIVDGLLNAAPGQAVSSVDETRSFVVSSAN